MKQGQKIQESRKPVEIAQLDQMSAVRSGRSSKFETKTVLKPKIVGLSPHLRGNSNHNQLLPDMEEIQIEEQENGNSTQFAQNSRTVTRVDQETALTKVLKNDSTLSKKSDALYNRTQGFQYAQKTLAQQLSHPLEEAQVFEVKKISISPKLKGKNT